MEIADRIRRIRELIEDAAAAKAAGNDKAALDHLEAIQMHVAHALTPEPIDLDELLREDPLADYACPDCGSRMAACPCDHDPEDDRLQAERLRYEYECCSVCRNGPTDGYRDDTAGTYRQRNAEEGGLDDGTE